MPGEGCECPGFAAVFKDVLGMFGWLLLCKLGRTGEHLNMRTELPGSAGEACSSGRLRTGAPTLLLPALAPSPITAALTELHTDALLGEGTLALVAEDIASSDVEAVWPLLRLQTSGV
jgi:hypothetical protein